MIKTNTGLVAYAKAQLGKPYWMGTFGQHASEWLYNYNKERMPQYYTDSDFPSQYGQKVHDCIGLIKGYLWSVTPDDAPQYNPYQDVDADTMQELCTEGGSIETIPELPGILVFAPSHVGVYIGSGEVVEARGHKWGVVQTSLHERTWHTWGKCPWIDYVTTAVTAPPKEETPVKNELPATLLPTTGTVMLTPLPIVRIGSTGKAVWSLQFLLNEWLEDVRLVLDGECGAKTVTAIKLFQTRNGLGADGECGKMTWAKLING